MAFKVKKLNIPEVFLITPVRYLDSRGYFQEQYKSSDFLEIGIKENFVQDNFSFSERGVLRGLHFQLPPKSQSKLVSCVAGKIWDVAVDVRKKSSTFGQWVAEELSQENGSMLYIPEGFAHGFVVLSETANVYYKAGNFYDAKLETGIVWNDINLNIPWPVVNPIVSKKDLQLPNFLQAKYF